MTVVARQSMHASSPDVNAEAVAATRYSMEGRDKGRERRQALISRVIKRSLKRCCPMRMQRKELQIIKTFKSNQKIRNNELCVLGKVREL